ncbi:helix-turn-helix transcriptional regulator [Bacillus sp. V3B]|jgi:putative transcriptional regulator|uniref:helix-turn-helix domain-containing protein n=1 Tax=Bacillus sp. V3B TaxID=2804915 RepID=UPI0021092444|nr:helix-turn-helix transcriptional regulator [Bacillus sp. V3B]MCQ6275412.1 helix-turn-helix transcriptional regulator [Bacillus sp. V3B]
MSFSYDPLWKLLIDKKMTKEKLRTAIKVSPATIAKMGRNENVAMSVLDRICTYLDCQLDDVVEYEKSNKEREVR